jgi:hypothetical protein
MTAGSLLDEEAVTTAMRNTTGELTIPQDLDAFFMK